ncbi:hypothetical protein JHK87_052480 [Glycine soja]|nr:hypothetical protein JHK87_052480 [Glycine soja]
MATPPRSPPHSDIPPEVTSRRTRQSTRLRRLTVRSLDQPRPIVNINPTTRRGSDPHKEKFHSYLGVVAREKIPIVHSNWNVVPKSPKDSQKGVPKSVGPTERGDTVATINPLGELVKNLFDVYQKPIELSWDGTKFGIPNAKDGFLITHADVTEIILGDKCLNISILHLWMIAMKKLSSSLEGKADEAAPRWIEPKSHVQPGSYECGYYVMHWMWFIVSDGLKNEWNKVCIL